MFTTNIRVQPAAEQQQKDHHDTLESQRKKTSSEGEEEEGRSSCETDGKFRLCRVFKPNDHSAYLHLFVIVNARKTVCVCVSFHYNK